MSLQATAIDLTETSTLAKFQVGGIHIDTLGRKWQYVKGTATIAQYDYVKISTDGLYTIAGVTTTTNPSTEPAQVGCVQNSGFTSTLYGWVIRSGAHTGNVAGAVAANVKLNIQASPAGKVDDAAGTLINGLTATVLASGAGSTSMFAVCDMVSAAS